MLIALTCLQLFAFEQPTVVKEFQSTNLGEPLSFPCSMHFSPDGKLFLADFNNHKIYVWNKDGSFLKTFGEEGQGPGELHQPTKVTATDKLVYVWDQSRVVKVFDHEGNPKQTIKLAGYWPRNFAVLNPNLLLLGYNKYISGTEIKACFSLVDATGQEIEMLQEYDNEATLDGEVAPNTAHIKAYMPDVDIQKAENGNYIFGFSQTKELFEIDANGKIVNALTHKLPAAAPSDRDREIFENVPVPSPEGFKPLKEIKTLHVNYSFPKAYYTHILMRDGKAVYITTPLGGMEFRGNGYFLGQYYVTDFKTGKVLSRGEYEYPEHSMVLYRDGRVLLAYSGEEDFSIKEIRLKGM